jgi:glycosyltransferase 2 family protein
VSGAIPPRETGRGWREVTVSWALVILVLAGFAVAVGDRWGDVRASLETVSVASVVGAWVIVTVALLGPWRAWVSVVTDLGNPLPWRASGQIFFIGQLGKYLPGAIWPVLLQMRMGRAVGVPRTRIAVSFVITLIVGVATGLVFGVLVVPAIVEDTGQPYAWILLLLPLAAVAVHPKVLRAVAQQLLRLTKRPPADFELTNRGALRAAVWTSFFWVVGGLHLWLLVVELGADPLASLPVSIGALALAVSIGPLFVVLPAGAGLREAVIVAALTSVLPLSAAVAAALVSRAVLVLGDGALALGAFLAARRIS